jgi:hypothetical protein
MSQISEYEIMQYYRQFNEEYVEECIQEQLNNHINKSITTETTFSEYDNCGLIQREPHEIIDKNDKLMKDEAYESSFLKFDKFSFRLLTNNSSLDNYQLKEQSQKCDNCIIELLIDESVNDPICFVINNINIKVQTNRGHKYIYFKYNDTIASFDCLGKLNTVQLGGEQYIVMCVSGPSGSDDKYTGGADIYHMSKKIPWTGLSEIDLPDKKYNTMIMFTVKKVIPEDEEIPIIKFDVKFIGIS